MSDEEKLDKVLKYVTAEEEHFYKPIEEGKYEVGVWQTCNVCFKHLLIRT